MSEGEAHRRIAAARVVRKFPLARTYLERGRIHLCAIYALYKHITEDNHEELLREAAGKTTKEVSAMIAARFPKPDVHPCIEPLEPQPALPGATTGSMSRGDAYSATPSTASGMRPRVEPLSATRYRIELTVSCETKEKLERVRDLMRHRNPSGDLEKIFDVSIDLLLTKLEKERLGKTSRPKAGKSATHSDVKRMNCASRDDTTTAHSGVDGMNCASRDDATTTHLDVAGMSCASRDDATAAHTDVNGMNCASRDDAGTTHRDDAMRLQRSAGRKTHRDDAGSSSTRDNAPSPLREEAIGPRRGAATTHRAEAPRSRRADATLHRAEATGSQRADATAHREGATDSQHGVATNARREGATSSLPGDNATAHRRHIPRAVWREVVARDGEQCTYVDAEGNRCPARGFLELDHVKAKALSGSDDVANLRLRCTVHNRLHAEQVFGREYIAQRIHLRRRKSAACLAPVFETAALGLRSLGFREHEVRNVIARLATSLDEVVSVEAVIRDALRLLT